MTEEEKCLKVERDMAWDREKKWMDLLLAHDRHWRAVATELGTTCAGVDAPVMDPNSTAGACIEAIRKLKLWTPKSGSMLTGDATQDPRLPHSSEFVGGGTGWELKPDHEAILRKMEEQRRAILTKFGKRPSDDADDPPRKAIDADDDGITERVSLEQKVLALSREMKTLRDERDEAIKALKVLRGAVERERKGWAETTWDRDFRALLAANPHDWDWAAGQADAMENNRKERIP